VTISTNDECHRVNISGNSSDNNINNKFNNCKDENIKINNKKNENGNFCYRICIITPSIIKSELRIFMLEKKNPNPNFTIPVIF